MLSLPEVTMTNPTPSSNSKPYFKFGDSITIYNDDILKIADVEPRSIDLIVTSPPYNVDVQYREFNDGKPYKEYMEFTEEWLGRVRKFAKRDGRMCLNIPLDKNKGGQQSVYADIVTRAKKAGWKYHSTIIWNEQNISRRTAWGSWLSASAPYVIAPVEAIVIMYKSEWKKTNKGLSDITRNEFLLWTNGMWDFNGESAKRVGHPSPFPLELPRRCIKLFSYVGDTVLDPFLGSGSTLVSCYEAKRKGIGVEINEEYCKIAADRLLKPSSIKQGRRTSGEELPIHQKQSSRSSFSRKTKNYLVSSKRESMQNFWIFQANPKRFKVVDWWRHIRDADQWQINKSYRDNVRDMGINAIWVAMIDGNDVWSIERQYRGQIAANDTLQATLLAEKFDSWSVFEHKNQIRKDDLAAIWVSGKSDEAGVYAIANIVSNPYQNPLPTEGYILYWAGQRDREILPKRPWLKVSMRYLTLPDPPWRPLLSRSSILEDEKLQDLIILRFSQATNFGPVPTQEWERIIELTQLSSHN
jgi:site-specific DNA-methyltransferase (adenine-specific)